MTIWTPEDIEKKKRENSDLARVNQAAPPFTHRQQASMPKSAPESKSDGVEPPAHIKSWLNGKAPANKYHAMRTYSELCDRSFDSKAEAIRGEELALLQKAKKIEGLRYQIRFELCEKPKITITIDFAYLDNNTIRYEDVKGVLTRDSRTKLAWLKEKHGIEVRLTK